MGFKGHFNGVQRTFQWGSKETQIEGMCRDGILRTLLCPSIEPGHGGCSEVH